MGILVLEVSDGPSKRKHIIFTCNGCDCEKIIKDSSKKKIQHKIEIEEFTIDKNDNLKLLYANSLGEVQ